MWQYVWNRYRLSPVVLAALLAACGCSRSYAPEEHRVEPVLARDTLKSVLTSWQKGETAESWRQHDPEVVIQDMDWTAGKDLRGFQLLDAGEAVDANLHCQVKLTLVDPQQGPVEETVTYLVTTSPKLTIFRAIEP